MRQRQAGTTGGDAVPAVDRPPKKLILDELCATTRSHRDLARKALRGCVRPRALGVGSSAATASPDIGLAPAAPVLWIGETNHRSPLLRVASRSRLSRPRPG